MRYVLDNADIRKHSWTYWQYKYYNDVTTAARPSEAEGMWDAKGNLIQDKVKLLTRPYVHKSSLPIQEMKFDHKTNTLKVVLVNKPLENKLPLVHLYLNEDYYFKNGASCQVESCTTCRMMKSANLAGSLDTSRHHYTIDLSASSSNDSTIRIFCKQI